MDTINETNETSVFVISPPSEEELSIALLAVIDRVLRQYGYG